MDKILQKLGLAAIGAALFCAQAEANTNPQQMLKMPTKEELIGEDACALVAAYSAAQRTPEDMIPKAQLCGRADKETCRDTKSFVMQYQAQKGQDPIYLKGVQALVCR